MDEPITIAGPAIGIGLFYLFLRWKLYPVKESLKDYEKQRKFAIFIGLVLASIVTLSVISSL